MSKEFRKAKMIFAKNGSGFLSTKMTIPVPWAKEMGLSENDRNVLIEFDDDKIIIRKEVFNMLLIKEKNVRNSLGNEIAYLLENGTELYDTDWNGEKYINGFKDGSDTNDTYKPVYRYQLENVDLVDVEENSDEWYRLTEIVGFEN